MNPYQSGSNVIELMENPPCPPFSKEGFREIYFQYLKIKKLNLA
jgi:hypothetical protein